MSNFYGNDPARNGTCMAGQDPTLPPSADVVAPVVAAGSSGSSDMGSPGAVSGRKPGQFGGKLSPYSGGGEGGARYYRPDPPRRARRAPEPEPSEDLPLAVDGSVNDALERVRAIAADALRARGVAERANAARLLASWKAARAAREAKVSALRKEVATAKAEAAAEAQASAKAEAELLQQQDEERQLVARRRALAALLLLD